ncbi:MAG: transposase [Eubacteriales bacterium]
MLIYYIVKFSKQSNIQQTLLLCIFYHVILNSTIIILFFSYLFFNLGFHQKDVLSHVKETFNGFGNAMDYLGRYTHRVAISNSRIKNVSATEVTYEYKNYKTNQKEQTTVSYVEFIRRFLMHVLPTRFQKIRYYGFLSNRFKSANLKLITKLIGKQLFQSKYVNASIDEIMQDLWNIDIHKCPICGGNHLQYKGRTYHMRN